MFGSENNNIGLLTFSLLLFDVFLFIASLPRLSTLFRFRFDMVRQFCVPLGAQAQKWTHQDFRVSTPKIYHLLQKCLDKNSKTTDLLQ